MALQPAGSVPAIRLLCTSAKEEPTSHETPLLEPAPFVVARASKAVWLRAQESARPRLLRQKIWAELLSRLFELTVAARESKFFAQPSSSLAPTLDSPPLSVPCLP